MKPIKMRHYFRIILCSVALMALWSCFDDERDPELTPSEPDSNGYCLMFYGSGGDPEHDLSMMTAFTQGALATADHPEVAVTCLFKVSGKSEGEAHNGVHRYTAEDGVLVTDNSFIPDADFNITDPSHLTDFIRWSTEKYPGRKYLLVFAGHGLSFTPKNDLPVSRVSIKDGKNGMSAAQFAQGIRNSGIHLDALIAHSCQQGSVEMLAEWEGLADYLMGSPFSIPDLCYDYYHLVTDLSEGHSVEETLSRTAHRTMNLWQEAHDAGYFGTVIEVTHLNDLTPLWETLRETFGHMTSSLDNKNFTTDPPSVLGATYKEGYQRALYAMYNHNEDDFFEKIRADHAVDLSDFLHNAYIYSGDMGLAAYLNRLDKVIGDMLVCHLQSNGKHDFIYNVYVCKDLLDAEVLGRYRTCRFDLLTGWSDLCGALLGTSDTWTAGTVLNEAEIELSGGLDALFKFEEIDDNLFSRMWQKSWEEDCPLDRSELRYLKVLHRNADGKPQRGEMVVNAAIADKVTGIFRQLYNAGYRIERMVLVDNYDAEDEASMRANNSSSFNFRFISGTTKISKHGYGLAIDINPLYNPFVLRQDDGSWHIEPVTGEAYAFDREVREDIPYKIDHNDSAYKLFTEAGFEWGGDWTTRKDYQHFEINL